MPYHNSKYAIVEANEHTHTKCESFFLFNRNLVSNVRMVISSVDMMKQIAYRGESRHRIWDRNNDIPFHSILLRSKTKKEKSNSKQEVRIADSLTSFSFQL